MERAFSPCDVRDRAPGALPQACIRPRRWRSQRRVTKRHSFMMTICLKTAHLNRASHLLQLGENCGPTAQPIPAWGNAPGYVNTTFSQAPTARPILMAKVRGGMMNGGAAMERAFSPCDVRDRVPGALPQAGMRPRRWRYHMACSFVFTETDVRINHPPSHQN